MTHALATDIYARIHQCRPIEPIGQPVEPIEEDDGNHQPERGIDDVIYGIPRAFVV